MAVTQAQIEAALLYTALFKLNQTSAPINSIGITDATNWIAIGVNTGGGDTISYLYKITDPSGIVVYENNGFAGDDYSSPDSATLANVLLNVTAGGKAVTGIYLVDVKVKVVDDGTTVYAEKVFEFNLRKSLTCIKAKVEITFDCTTAVATSTDTTNYNASGYNIISNTRVHTLYPPETSGQTPTVGSGQIVTHTDLLAPATYESDFTTNVVYRTSDNLVTVNAYFTAKTEAKSSCDDVLCKMFCCLKKLEDKYAELVRNPTMQVGAWDLLLKGIVYYDLAKAARLCGNEAKVTYYASKFYTSTGCDPNCDCCDDVAPVIPAGPCECTDGTDGREVEMQALTGGSNKIIQYRYVGDAGWITLCTITPTAGTPGASGTSLIHSDPEEHLTTVTTPQTLSTFSTDHTNDAKNLVNVGDTIELYSCYRTTDAPNAVNIFVTTIMNGVGVVNQTLNITNTDTAEDLQIELFTKIILADNTSGAMVVKYKSEVIVTNIGGLASRQIRSDIGTLTGADFAVNDYSFAARAQSQAEGDISLQIYQAKKLTSI